MTGLSTDELQELVSLGNEVPSARLQEVASNARALLQDIRQGAGDREMHQNGLLMCFRVMRNAAASGPATCDALLRFGLLDLVCATLDLISVATIALDWQLPAVVSQALANLCNACSTSAAAAWAAIFPQHLGMLAAINEGRTQAATCLVLLACCKAVPGAAVSLAGDKGGHIMTALLCHQRMMQQGEHIDDFGLLAAHLCFTQDLLPCLFQSVGSSAMASCSRSSSSNDDTAQPTLAQTILLGVLCAEASEMADAAPEGLAETSLAAAASMQFLVQLVEQLATASMSQGSLNEGQQQLMQEALQLIRGICACDDSGSKLAGTGNLVASLQAAGLVPALLAMLKALEPIQNPQQHRETANAAGPTTSDGSSIQVAELAPLLALRAQSFPATPPYTGFRTDLLAALANAAYRRPALQSEVCALGGVELVLAQCRLDRNSPFAREWALWGIRNMCEGNAQAQEAIRQLQLCVAVDSEELQQMGVRLEIDEGSGKLKVTKRESNSAG